MYLKTNAFKDGVAATPWSACLIIFLLVCTLLLTQNFVSPTEITPASRIGAGINYQIIHHSIINDSAKSLIHVIESHHLERAIPTILTSELSRISRISFDSLEKALVLIFLICVTFLFYLRFGRINAYEPFVLYALVIYNPYLFRYYFATPYTLNDSLFFFSICLLVFGLLLKKSPLIYVFVLLSVFARQTSITLIPFLAYLAIRGTITWNFFFRLLIAYGIAFSVCSLILQTYFGDLASITLEKPYFLHHISGFGDWAALLYGDDNAKSSFVRLLLFLFLLTPLLLVAKRESFDIPGLGFILVAAQPVLAGPFVTGDNIQRLISYTVPFVFLIKLQVRRPAVSAVSVLLIILMSLHHHFGKTYIEQPSFWALTVFVLGSIPLIVVTFGRFRSNLNQS